MCKHKYRKVNNDAVVLKVEKIHEEKKGNNIKKFQGFHTDWQLKL